DLLARVAHHAVDRAGRPRLLGQPRELLLLPHVEAEGDDLATVLLDQPLQDDRGVEPSAVRETHPPDLGTSHARNPPPRARSLTTRPGPRPGRPRAGLLLDLDLAALVPVDAPLDLPVGERAGRVDGDR